MMRLTHSLSLAVLALSLTAASQAQQALSDDATHGKELFASKNCALCHNADSEEKKIGPGLKGLYARGTMADGTKVKTKVDDNSDKVKVKTKGAAGDKSKTVGKNGELDSKAKDASGEKAKVKAKAE